MERYHPYQSIRTWLTIGPYENDEGFRELLQSISRKGMLVLGSMGAVILVSYVGLYILFGVKTVAWTYMGIDPQKHIILWDKGFILLTCFLLMYISRISLSLEWNRTITFGFTLLICLAMLMDDILADDLSFAAAYLVVVMVIAVGTIPFTGWQTALLGFSVITTCIIATKLIPALFYLPDQFIPQANIIYLSVITLLLTGLSSLIYLNRYDQYRVRRQAEELKEKLEERAKVLEELKKKSDEQAEKIMENERLKDQFFTGISHEFRTPLTLMIGPLKDMLTEMDEQEKRPVNRQELQLMYKNGLHLLQLINQLLDLSKIDAGEIHLDLEKLDICTLVRETALSFSSLTERKVVKLEIDIESEPIVVRGDLQQLERVFRNLISNALKFTPKGGAVNVKVNAQSSTKVEVEVMDTGIGIEASDLPHIFDRFYQAAHSTDTYFRGTGIGLALVREIVELHGGSVQVSSTPGSGSTFTVTLKTEPEQSLAAEPMNGDSSLKERWEEITLDNPFEIDEDGRKSDSQSANVLLIDDNRDILAYLRPHLSERYHTIIQDSSKKALEILRTQTVDLVISDVMMPAPDGFELCRIIKEDPELSHVPVILLTARAGEEDRIEGLELGADDYLGKPFNALELMTRVENLIDIRRKLKEKYSKEVRLEGTEIDVTSADARFLEEVQSVIEKHIEDSNFGVDWLADEVNLSPRQLQRKIRSITELSAGGYIRMIRLERASQLLAQQWGNIAEVSYKVGFQDTRYFSKLFKQTFGTTPSEFMAEHTGES